MDSNYGLHTSRWGFYTRTSVMCLLMTIMCGNIFAQTTPQAQQTFEKEAVTSAGDDYIQFYQRFLSDQKNSHCAMFPSCSDYGRLVLKSEPFYKAIPAIADRLIRCSRDKQHYTLTSHTGSTRYLDFPDDSLANRYKDFRNPYADVIVDKSNPLSFINYLINEQDYNGALLEIRREQFYRPNDALYLPKLICYRGLKNPLQAVFEYEAKFPESVRKASRINYQAALAYYELDNHIDLRRTLNYGILHAHDTLSYAKIYSLMALSYVKEEKYDSARITFAKANEWSKDYNLYSFNQSKLYELQTMRQKSPALAKSLSIIPGLGYLYTGHKGSALTSFLVNSLLGYATYTCFDKKNYGLGAICGFLNLSFYIGNLNGAARSAHRYNQIKKNKSIKTLETHNQILLTY